MKIVRDGIVHCVGGDVNLSSTDCSLLDPEDGRPSVIVANTPLEDLGPERCYELSA